MKKGGIIAIIVSVVLLVVALVAVLDYTEYQRRQFCMGIPVISEEEVGEIRFYSKFDLTNLTFNNQEVAVATGKYTVYLPVNPDKLGAYYDLEGKFQWNDPNSTAKFVKDAALENIEESIRTGEPLSLLISNGERHRKVKVILTTLPVIAIDGEVTHKNEEKRDVWTGKFTVWTAEDPETGKYSVTTSDVQWHRRGNSTSKQPKNSWKLSLKDPEGNNNHLNLMGLGADDDWIMNSMTMDDTRIREALMMDLWNTMIEGKDYHYPMSTGKYAEVLINEQYMGLYLMQRRVDKKYLQLDDDTVLLKVTQYGETKAKDAYEFVTDPVNTKEVYALMQKVLDRTDCSSINLYNMVDLNIMLQFAAARDNFGLKNMYHVLEKTENGYEQFLLPWDTDMSFGTRWEHGIGFVYEYDTCVKEISQRKETQNLRKYHKNYAEVAIERWAELRGTVLDQEYVFARIDALCSEITENGALARDVKLWGDRYSGQDTIENMKKFITERLALLDEYHASVENYG